MHKKTKNREHTCGIEKRPKDKKDGQKLKKQEDEWSIYANPGSLLGDETDVEPCPSDMAENGDNSGTEKQHAVDRKCEESITEGEQNTTCNDALVSKASVASKDDLPCSSVMNQAKKASKRADQPSATTLLETTEQLIVSIVVLEDEAQGSPRVETAEAKTFNRLITPFPNFVSPASQGVKSTLRCKDPECKCSEHLGKESPGAKAPEIYISEPVFPLSSSIHPLASTDLPSAQKQTESQKHEEKIVVCPKISLVGRNPAREKKPGQRSLMRLEYQFPSRKRYSQDQQ